MTTVINLYGGCGVGKSTIAALFFARMKIAGGNIELVREYVKSWAWAGRNVNPHDQLYLLGKQSAYESLLYGKVDYIVTDSPVLLAGAYAERSCGDDGAYVTEAAKAFYRRFEKESGVEYVNFFVSREGKKYNPRGRYETEDQARNFDVFLSSFLQRHVSSPIHSLTGTEEDRVTQIARVLSDQLCQT